MLRGTARALRTVSRISQLNQAPSECSISHRPWVGCSHWTTPFRPLNPFSTSTQSRLGTVRDKNLDRSSSLREDLESNVDREDVWDKGNAEDVGIETSLEGIIVDQVDPSDTYHTQPRGDENNTLKDKHMLKHQPPPTSRPQLPTSIKRLNRLLSHSREISIPESDLIETFVRGRGPGGQAINKTNSSVSLIHIPTGIRIQSQPTRSREENRKIARKILGERLDLIRARATATAKAGPQGEGAGVGTEVKTRKEKEKVLAGQWSRDEIRWEKERRRKSNKAKKAKKKHGAAGSGGTDPGQEGGVGAE